MDNYFRSATLQKTYKISQEKENTYMYWVAVHETEGGGFLHARGKERAESMEKAMEMMAVIAKPVKEEDYITALKDYFAIDKKVRESFIKNYKL